MRLLKALLKTNYKIPKGRAGRQKRCRMIQNEKDLAGFEDSVGSQVRECGQFLLAGPPRCHNETGCRLLTLEAIQTEQNQTTKQSKNVSVYFKPLNLW